MRIISAVFALVGALPIMPAAVASSLDGATRLYALLIFVLICAAVAFFASLSPSRRRAREIRRQVLQQQQNQAINQQVPPPQAPNQQGPSQSAPQQVPLSRFLRTNTGRGELPDALPAKAGSAG